MNRLPTSHSRLTTRLLLLLSLGGLMGGLQLQAQTVLRTGEQRFNRFQFKATHNSFERDGGLVEPVSITEQLDRYDIWMLELDLRWHEDNNDFYVMHTCLDDAGSNTLDFFLDQIAASNRRGTGVTFVYFDSGDIGPCLLYPNIVPKPTNWQSLLETKLTARFGTNVYTKLEFTSSGGHASMWPSPQELLRRGKNIIPIVNGAGTSYFFGGNQFLSINTSDQTATIPSLGDDKFSRWYPTGWICGFNPDWSDAVINNFSFPASNCSDISNPRFHPPLPTYVDTPASVGAGRGSWLDPFRGPSGFQTALNVVSQHEALKGASMINIQLASGTHTAPARISTAVRLTSSGGTVRLVR